MFTVLDLAVRLAASVAGAVLAGARVHVLTDEALEALLCAETTAALIAGRRLAEQELNDAADAAIDAYRQRTAVGQNCTFGRSRMLANGATLHAVPGERITP